MILTIMSERGCIRPEVYELPEKGEKGESKHIHQDTRGNITISEAFAKWLANMIQSPPTPQKDKMDETG